MFAISSIDIAWGGGKNVTTKVYTLATLATWYLPLQLTDQLLQGYLDNLGMLGIISIPDYLTVTSL